MSVLLGCIADDFTGATDLGGFLVKQGFRTIQLNGIPDRNVAIPEVDALVVALKSRTIAPDAAITQSLEALEFLQQLHCEQFYFKYCSTFDSTEKGNIGPVMDALLEALGAEFTIACPALPVNGRSVYQGHLFVNGVILNESGMQHHPLTPMTDPNLVRFLGKQVKRKVGLVPFEVVDQGADAIQTFFQELQATGHRYAVVDAVSESQLNAIGQAVKDLKLITGGSGLSINLAANFELPSLSEKTAARLPKIPGNGVILSGSCSVRTQEQVAQAEKLFPSFYLDPFQLQKEPGWVEEAIQWALTQIPKSPVLIYTTGPPEKVQEIQKALGEDQAGEIIESALTMVAQALAKTGVRKFVIAGGETSGAIVKALGMSKMQIGPEIAPGVPWCVGLGEPPVLLALKSGNFGSVDFFQEALEKVS
jgi:uncharacterized protein YgbK (DUF1537 family)